MTVVRTKDNRIDSHEAHVGSLATVLAWIGLLALTSLSFIVSYWNLGALNMTIALVIAVAKTVIVMFIFMHLLESSFAPKMAILVWVFLFALLVGLTAADVATRTTFPKNGEPRPAPSGTTR